MTTLRKPNRREFLAALSVGAGMLHGATRNDIKVSVSLDDSTLSGTANGKNRWVSRSDRGKKAVVVEHWTDTPGGRRCEVEIRGGKKSWSAPIRMSVAYPGRASTRFWTAWDRQPDGPRDEWADPMVPAPLRAIRYTYGGPRYTMERPGIPWYSWGQQPNGENYFSVPVLTWVEAGESGCSVVVSPEPMQLDFEMELDPSGRLDLLWYRHRLSSDNPVRLAFDIVHHGDDCREGLGWMTNRYPEYFHPPNPAVQAMAGAGAYSTFDGDLDAQEMRRMAFSVNWRASFDFPYMGMFLPPVSPTTEWTSFRHTPTSIAGMEAYCRKMKDSGFYVLSYFNVMDFGTQIHYPPTGHDKVPASHADWRDPNQFLYSAIPSALLYVPPKLPLHDIKWPGGWEQTRPGGPFYSWEKGIGVDPGEPVYSDYLMEQARRHLKELPSSSGFCLDRMDWVRFYNLDRDDKVTWFDDGPARSLFWSWQRIMDKLGPLVHQANKVIFVNPIYNRLDALKHVDGIFDEMADHPAALNGAALSGLFKPVIAWRDAPVPANQVDSYFQKLLYLGAFPMCPYPQNDHALDWGTPETRKPFTDYGPLLSAVRGRKWVLKPRAFEVENAQAKANLFTVPGGYSLPVVFGKADEVVVNVKGVIADGTPLDCDALYPGDEKTQAIEPQWKGGSLALRVPLRRGCALVRIRPRSA